jgi:hypothetical protein
MSRNWVPLAVRVCAGQLTCGIVGVLMTQVEFTCCL